MAVCMSKNEKKWQYLQAIDVEIFYLSVSDGVLMKRINHSKLFDAISKEEVDTIFNLFYLCIKRESDPGFDRHGDLWIGWCVYPTRIRGDIFLGDD